MGDRIIISFVDPERSGEYRMTTDPRAAAVISGNGTASVSIPLNAFVGHQVTVYETVTQDGQVKGTFYDSVQGAKSIQSKFALAAGSYQLNVAITDLTTGTTTRNTVDFEVK